jgi:uncharacterized protein DUF927/Cch-like protein
MVTNGTTNGHGKFSLSLFNNKFDASPKPVERTWEEICARIAKPQVRADKDGPLFSPAVFEPLQRKKENVRYISELVLDYDHRADFDQDLDVWRGLGLAFAAYTTHSSYRETDSNPDGEERFRVIVPLLEPIPGAEFPKLWRWAAERTGGKVDPQAKDASRMFYTPAIAEEGARYRYDINNGVMLDWRGVDLKQEPEPSRQYDPPAGNGRGNGDAYGRKALEAEVGRVAMAAKGGRNAQLNASAFALGQLVGGGVLQRYDVEDALHRAASGAGLKDQEIKQTLKSGIEAGIKDPRTAPEKPMRQSRPAARPSRTTANAAADATEPEAEPDSDLEKARMIVAGLGGRLSQGTKVAFEPEVLGALALLRQQSPGDFQEAKEILRGAKVSLRDIERELKKYQPKLRLVQPDDDPTQYASDFLKDAPIPDLIIPDGYKLESDRTLGQVPNPMGFLMMEPIAFGAMLITGRTKDIDAEMEGLRLSWKRGGFWRHRIVDRGIVASARELVSLANMGFPVTSSDAKLQVEYFARLEAANFSALPTARTTSHMGWQGADCKQGFSIGKDFIGPDGATVEAEIKADAMDWSNKAIAFRGASAGDDQIVEGYHCAGSFDGWTEAAAKLVPYPRALSAVYGSFAAPLLQLLGLPNFIIDLAARTSQGKTTAQRAAASVWGSPDERKPGAALQTWDITKVGIERVSAVLNGIPLILDDTKRAKDPRIIADALYLVTSGRGRVRGSLTGLQVSKTWHTVLISSGEQPVTSFTNDGGTRMRVLEIQGAPFGKQDAETGKVVELFNLAVMSNYGYAGRRFVKWLIENFDQRDEWKAEINRRAELYVKAAASERAGRLALYAATIAQAASLAHQALDLPWTFEDPIEKLWAEISGEAEDAVGAKRALRYLLSWAWANEVRFIGREQENRGGIPVAPASGWIGRWDRDEKFEFIGFYPHHVEDVLRAQNFNPDAVMGEWRERGWLRVKDDGRQRFTCLHRLRGETKSAHLITVLREGINEVDE